MNFQDKRPIVEKGSYDVVVGGGIAALAVKSVVGVDAIDIKELQSQLINSGAYPELDF